MDTSKKGGTIMKVIKLYGMVLENFKGISKLAIDFKGNDTVIEGDNEAGKTTVVDGFLWALFGKDSNNRKDFEIKTIVNGDTIHNVNHSVELKLIVDGVETTLKRTFKEVYKKSRGGIEKTFSGHKTEYEFNGVPCNEKEYKANVDSIVNEEVFKLITNPLYFNEMKWQDQRKLLFQLVEGNAIDPLSFNNELEPLRSLLEQYSPEETKAIYMAKRKKAKEQVDTIPSRIDELQRMNNSSAEGAEEAEKEIEKIELYIDDLRGQIARIKSGSSIVQLEREIQENKSKLYNLELEGKKGLQEELDRTLTNMEEIVGNGQIYKAKKQDLEFKLADNKNGIRVLNESISVIKVEQDSLREKFYEERDKQFEFEDVCECPTCNQSLPDDEVKSVREKAALAFEESKKISLEVTKTKGVSLKEKIELAQGKIEILEEENVHLNAQLVDVNVVIDKLLKEHVSLNEKKESLKLAIQNQVESEEVMSIKKDIKELTVKLAENKTNSDEMVTDLENEVSIQLKKRNELNLIVSQKHAIAANKKRIEELQLQLQEQILEFDNIDRILYLLGEYNRTKVEALSESINELFSITKFKLFNQLVNGEYEETCEALHKGIPYNKNLNTAAKINVGLDIINVLCKHFEVVAPVFVDNSESVTKFIDINGQCVRLYVKEGQKTLNVKEVI